MATQVSPIGNIESIFHSLTDMNLTKKERGRIASLLARAVNSGIRAQAEGNGAEAGQHADWLAKESAK